MCGFAARVASEDVTDDLRSKLRSFEYPDCDAAGIAVADGDEIAIDRRTDDDPVGAVDPGGEGRCGLCRVRWSPEDRSADRPPGPYTDPAARVATVIGGTVWNADALRADLREHDREAGDRPDAAVVPRLVERYLAGGDPPEAALRRAARRLEGEYALVAVVADRDAVYAVRSGAPLFLGLAEDGYCLASHGSVFDREDEVVPLRDGDVAVVTPSIHAVTDLDGSFVVRPIEPTGNRVA